MNFDNYRRQVYNVGSPTPTALRNFAETFPAVRNPTSSAKRKFEPDEQTVTQKSSKMVKVGDMEFSELCDALKNAFREDFDKVTRDIQAVKTDMETDRKGVSDLGERVGVVERDLTTMKEQINKIAVGNADELQKAVLPEVEKIVVNTVNTQWQDVLVNEVKQEENKLLVYGQEWPTGDPVKGFQSFCKDSLKMEPDRVNRMTVKEVVRLGSSKNGKPAPQLVKLASATERNDCLRLSKNLKQGVNLDMCVPKRYLEKYKTFKNLAWKLRVVRNVSTFIGFDRQALQLKVKKKDDGNIKYDWTIHAEFIPKPSKMPAHNKEREPREGLIPTPPLDDADTDCVCIVSGIKDVRDSNHMAEKLQELFDEPDLDLIANISQSNRNCAILTCSDRDATVKVATKYNGKQFNGGKLSVQIFSPKK